MTMWRMGGMVVASDTLNLYKVIGMGDNCGVWMESMDVTSGCS